MFSSSNEPGGTSYRHRFEDPNILLQEKLVHRKLKDSQKHSEKQKLNKKVYLTKIEIMRCL